MNTYCDLDFMIWVAITQVIAVLKHNDMNHLFPTL